MAGLYISRNSIQIPYEAISEFVAIMLCDYFKRCKILKFKGIEYPYKDLCGDEYYRFNVEFIKWQPSTIQAFSKRIDKQVSFYEGLERK